MSRYGFLLCVLPFLWGGCERSSNAQNNGAEPVFDITVLSSERLGSHQQLLLRLQLLQYGGDMIRFGLSMVPEHQERLRYYLQDFKTDVWLVSARDTIPCLDSHLERLHMDSPYRDFILTFPNNSNLQPTHLVVYDREYTGELLQLKLPVDEK